jgi:hypothetical protein
MNIHERRKMIRACMNAAARNGKSLMEALRDARPMSALGCKPKDLTDRGLSYDVWESEITDYSWISAVIDEGFDPNGPLGPTYWRITKATKSHYYSTFIGPDGEFGLLITELGSGLIEQALKRVAN